MRTFNECVPLIRGVHAYL